MRYILLLLSVFAGTAFAALPETLKFCTGAEGGFYDKLSQSVGRSIVRGTDMQVEYINTGGSAEVAERLKEGECDIGIMQGDAVASLPLPVDIEVTDAHVETVFWLHPKSGVDDFGKMEDSSNIKKYAVALVRGGGSQITMKKFAMLDKDYEKVRIVEFDDWMQAGKAIAQGYTTRNGERIEIAGGLYVGRAGAITSDITEDFGTLIQVGEVNDNDFADAKDANDNPLYSKCSLNEKQTSGLKTSTTLDADTYCMRAQIVYNNAFHNALDKADARKVSRMVAKGVNQEVKQYR